MDIANNLLIELETDSAGLPNLIRNNNGELGAWEWLTPVTNTTMSTNTTGGSCLVFTTTTSQAAYFTTEAHTATVGKYYSARLDTYGATASHTFRMSFQWLDSTGTLLSTTTASTAQTPGTSGTPVTAYYGAYQAPANTAYVRLRIDLYNGTGTTNPSANAYLWFRHAMITYSDTGTTVTSRTNLCPNPSFETNTSLWQTTLSTLATSTTVAQFGTSSLRATKNTGPGVMYVQSSAGNYITVTAGKVYTVSTYVRASSTVRPFQINLFWFKADGTTHISDNYGTAVTNTSTGWTRITTTATAPTNAARLQVDIRCTTGSMPVNEIHYFDGVLVEQAGAVDNYFDGSIVPAGYSTSAWNGTANASTSTTQTAANVFDYNDNVDYLDITGSSAEISMKRSELDLGQATVTIFDPALDPAQVATVRPGRRVRISMRDNTGTPQRIYTGTLSDASTVYDPKGQAKPQVTLSLADAIKDLSMQAEDRVVGAVADIPLVLEGKGVPWNVAGNTGQVATATVVATNDNADVLESIAITRDSTNAFAWVDRYGILQVKSSLPSATVHLTDNPSQMSNAHTYSYSDIDASFSTTDIINQVNVTYMRYNIGSGQTDGVTYGPYVDSGSVAIYGPVAKEFTIALATESAANVQAFANAVLAANAYPAVKVNSVTVPVQSLTQVTDIAAIDLYTNVGVTYADKFADQAHRIIGIEHTITPTGWTVTYTFQGTGSVASPALVSNAGTSDATNLAGVVQMFAGASGTVPSGWLLCDGSTFSSVTYPALAAVLGDTYGTHSGTTYYLPDLRGRFPLGAGVDTDGTNRALGAKTGSTHMTASQMPQHAHDINVRYSSDVVTTGGGMRIMAVGGVGNTGAGTQGTGTTGNTGSGTAYYQPLLALNFIIKV